MALSTWILVIWGVGTFIVMRWGSVPAMLQMYKDNVAKREVYAPYKEPPMPLPFYIFVAVVIAVSWPLLALYKLIWPRGIDYKAKKEARLKQEAEEEAARIKEAERVAREFGLKNPTE